jgi:hypothetical protein
MRRGLMALLALAGALSILPAARLAYGSSPAVLPAERIAVEAAREYKLSPFQLEALLCVRRIENGRDGIEYGVLHPRARDTDERTQARWAAGTIKKRLRHRGALPAFAKRWAPIGAPNDPRGLNRHWLRNMNSCLSGQPFSDAAAMHGGVL